MIPDTERQTHTGVWRACLQYIAERIDQDAFAAWFAPIVPMSLQSQVLNIQVPSQIYYEWLEQHYVSLLREAINRELGPGGRLTYTMQVQTQPEPALMARLPPGSKPTAKNIRHPAQQGSNGHSASTGTDPTHLRAEAALPTYLADCKPSPDFRFDNFVISDFYQFERAAAMTAAERPGQNSFNPLVYYGGVGLGKTHLLHAIGNKVQELHPALKVVYITAVDFADRFIQASKEDRIGEFAQAFMRADVLVMDDVQMLVNKAKTQEIFHNILTQLLTSRKQVVLSCDQHPRDLKGIHERIVSRLRGSLTAEIRTPDLHTRHAIIANKLAAEGLDADPDIIDYLARTVKTNVRDLEGVVVSLSAKATLGRRALSLELARETVTQCIGQVEREIDVPYIMRLVAAQYHVTVEEMAGTKRQAQIMLPRQVAIYLVREITGMPYKQIGSYFGGRDHTTVMHSIKAVQNLIDTSRKVRLEVEELRQKLKTL